MKHGRVGATVSVVAAIAALAGCATSSDDATRSSLTALQTRPATTVSPSPPPTSVPPCDTRSFRPDTPLPAPGNMPAGSAMATIQQRGYLRVGVDENTLGFAFRNQNGHLEGLEIDLVGEIARAIFEDPTRVQYISVVTDDKVKVVADGKVDLTASVVSINCARWQQVAFSTKYYTTVQRVLVNTDSALQHVADLGGRKVCVTKGSTTIVEIQKQVPSAVPYPVAARTDCLVALQEGRVDAIATHETILHGLQQQDPKTTRFLPESFGVQDYGIAIAKDHPEFVRFVNAVLDRMRADNQLAHLYADDLPKWGIIPPPVPVAEYRPDAP